MFKGEMLIISVYSYWPDPCALIGLVVGNRHGRRNVRNMARQGVF